VARAYAEIEVERVVQETPQAILVKLKTGEQGWVPKAEIHDDSEVFDKDNGAGTLLVSEWIAVDRGWV